MTTPYILIVEPDIAVRHPLAEYLRECGFKVVQAASSNEAMELLLTGNPKIDVVLADVHSQSDVDGFALATWIRQTGATVEIILAGTVVKTAEKAADICKDGPLLSKPYDHQILLDRIKGSIALRDRSESRDG